MFPENLPIGTIIGTFSANDPDGDTLTYSPFRDDNLDPDMIEMRIMELEALSQDPLQSSGEDLAQNAQENWIWRSSSHLSDPRNSSNWITMVV